MTAIMQTSRDQITAEAAEWLLRLEETGEERTRGEFVAWLKLSPRHLDEFLMVEAAWRTVHQFDPGRRFDLDQLVDSARAEVVPLPQKTLDVAASVMTGHSFSSRRRRLLTIAACFTLVVFGAAAWLRFESDSIFETRTGEQRSFKLPDGSVLYLNTQSRAQIDFSDRARNVQLLQGEALVYVAQDAARPFTMAADNIEVLAVGTAFNVYRRNAGAASISVIEGRVQIRARDRAETAALSAGEEADVDAGGIVKRVYPDVSRTLAWRQRRLVFRETPLVEVAAQFNRYNKEPRLEVDSEMLARRRITGTFNADDPYALVRFLRDDPTVRIAVRENTVLMTIADPQQ